MSSKNKILSKRKKRKNSLLKSMMLILKTITKILKISMYNRNSFILKKLKKNKKSSNRNKKKSKSKRKRKRKSRRNNKSRKKKRNKSRKRKKQNKKKIKRILTTNQTNRC